MPQPNALRFPTTDWSMVAHAADGDGREQRRAAEELLRRYVPVMRSYLRAKWRLPVEQADELLQGFLVAKVVEEGLLGKANRGRGRFRTFLATALDRYAIDQHRRAASASRQSGEVVSLEQDPDLEQAAPPEGDAFELAWAREVLRVALSLMQRDCEAAGRQDVWAVFEARVLGPMLENTEPVPLAELMRRLKLDSPEQVSNLAITAKRMFARGLRAILAKYRVTRDAANVGRDEEDHDIRLLMEVLSKPRA